MRTVQRKQTKVGFRTSDVASQNDLRFDGGPPGQYLFEKSFRWQDALGSAVELRYLGREEGAMVDERCPDEPPAQAPTTGSERMVFCVKFGRQMPGLERPPWKGELGKRIYENVSREAWRMWIEYSKMLLNEYRLNPLDPSTQKFLEERMEEFFFGEGARLPEGYVPPRSKSGY